MKHAFLAVMLAAVTTGVQAANTNSAAQAVKAPSVPATATNATQAVPPAGTPKIQFDKTVYDFGTTSQVTSVTGTFTFHNSGDAELKLQKPAPSCGCTVAKVVPESMALKPGEKGELMFTVNLGAARGALEKHINVPSNDPQSPNINLGIKVNVLQVFDVAPTQVAIGDIHLGEKTNVTVTVHRNDGKKLSITKTEVAGDFAKAHVEPGENEQSAKVLIDVAGQGAPRRFTDQVKLFMDGAEQPGSTIFVTGRLAGDVNVTPEALYWGVQDAEHWPGSYPETMTTRRIAITAGQNVKSLELKNLTSSLKEVTLELVAGEKGKSYTLVAKLAESPKESTRGTISFDTNIPTEPKVVLPVTVNVLKH